MRRALSLCLLGIAACPGSAPPNTNNQVDAAVVDDAPSSASLLLSGRTMDYFGNVPLEGVALVTDGLEPAQTAVSDPAGLYEMPMLVGSSLYLHAAKTDYRLTRSVPIAILADSVMADAYIMSVQDVKNQYTAVGATPTAGTAFVVAELRKPNNTPLEIPLAGIKLVDANNNPVTVKGPYAFNAAGSLDPAATSVTAYGGRSRIALLDVPPGSYTLSVTYDPGAGPVTQGSPVATTADGATLVLNGGGAGGTGTGVADPSFAMHIYPKLQRAAMGGLGCANCHTLTGPAAVLKYDDPAATVLANMKAATGVINLTTPADSLLLKRPLYEQPPAVQDHPNATFIDTNDADYKLFLLWITNGAKP